MCAVFGCGIVDTNHYGISTFGFPKNPNVHRAWVNFVKTTRKDFVLSPRYHAICAKHFTPECFEDQFTIALRIEAGYTIRRRLKADAVPTVLTDTCLAALNRERSKGGQDTSTESTTQSAVPPSVREKRVIKRDVMKVSPCARLLYISTKV